jgi:type II secretory ATPase GspE/PulE/Tfp pilus assembly ATPase PilB-like protein
VDIETRQMLGLGENETFYRGKGCNSCNNTGYHGRNAVSELLEITPQLAKMINMGASSQEIKQQAYTEGMKSLTQNALALARNKLTSIEEVLSVRLD